MHCTLISTIRNALTTVGVWNGNIFCLAATIPLYLVFSATEFTSCGSLVSLSSRQVDISNTSSMSWTRRRRHCSNWGGTTRRPWRTATSSQHNSPQLWRLIHVLLDMYSWSNSYFSRVWWSLSIILAIMKPIRIHYYKLTLSPHTHQ